MQPLSSFISTAALSPGAKGGSVLIARIGCHYKWLTRRVWDRARLLLSLPHVARRMTVLPALQWTEKFHSALGTLGGFAQRDIMKGMFVYVYSLVLPSVSSELLSFFVCST